MKSFSYTGGNLISYAEYGDPGGFPILAQHGLIASIEEGALFHRLDALGARLIGVARPGYGRSSPYEMACIAEWGEIIAAMADELGLSSFDVLGMSSGAPYSYAIGHKLPDRVRNIYILSGTPALYDPIVLAHWPYPVTKNATLAEMQQLAFELFFANLSEQERANKDIRDSMRNNCFGPALDLKLRVNDWGLVLSGVTSPVYMRHSRYDPAVPLAAAERTAQMLPNCKLEIPESGVHFSEAALDDFADTVIAPHYNDTIPDA